MSGISSPSVRLFACTAKQQQIDGPLFLGMDTHALSVPALASALEVLAANGVEIMIAEGDEYTPTPAISHAILTYNRGRKTGLADGIVITPSHNPPHDGGFKYNPPNGGPAEAVVTGLDSRQEQTNFLRAELQGVKRIPFAKALHASTTHRHDYLNAYIADLANVIDMDAIRGAKLRIGVDPLGGAGVHYWGPIAERYGLNLTVVNEAVDPTFRFMTVDWDGQIRMDPSSPYAMQRLIEHEGSLRSSPSPATPTMTVTVLSPRVRDCCRPTIIFPSPSSTSSNTARSGARKRPLGKRW